MTLKVLPLPLFTMFIGRVKLKSCPDLASILEYFLFSIVKLRVGLTNLYIGLYSELPL